MTNRCFPASFTFGRTKDLPDFAIPPTDAGAIFVVSINGICFPQFLLFFTGYRRSLDAWFEYSFGLRSMIENSIQRCGFCSFIPSCGIVQWRDCFVRKHHWILFHYLPAVVKRTEKSLDLMIQSLFAAGRNDIEKY